MDYNEKPKSALSIGLQIVLVILGSVGMFLLSRFGVMRAREYVMIQFTYPMLLFVISHHLRWKWTLVGTVIFTVLSVCIQATLLPPAAPCSALISRILLILKGLVTILIMKFFLQKFKGSQGMAALSVVLSSIVATLLYFAAVRYDMLERLYRISVREAWVAETLQYGIPGFVISGFVFMLGGFAAMGINQLVSRKQEKTREK